MCTVKNLQEECDNCKDNQGFSSWQNRKPCGQQNCWYSCTVCEYNGFIYDDTGECRGEDW